MTTTQLTEPRWAGLKEVLGMSYPIILGSLSITVMAFVDQIFVARLGLDALAAVGPAGLCAYTAMTLVLGALGCVSTFVAQSLGRGDAAACGPYAWQGIYLSLLSGLLALVLWPLTAPLFNLLPHSPEVTQLEIVYFKVRLLGFVPFAWMIVLTSFFQAVGRPGLPAIAGILGNIVNAVLAYGLIFGRLGMPNWGVAGAAAAMVIGTAIQMLFLQVVFLSKPFDLRFNTRRSFALDWVKIGELVRIGWGAGLASFMDIFNWTLFTMVIVGSFGQVALAAHNVAINFMQVSFMPAIGIHNGIAPIVGRYIGEGDIPRAKARTYTAIRICMAYMVTIGLIMAIFGQSLIRLFFDPPAEVVRVGHALLILAALFQAFDAINIAVMGALRGAGDTRWMAVVVVVAAYGGFLPLALLLGFTFDGGAIGAWIGATAYIIGLSGVLFWRFQGERWRGIRIFAKDRIAASAE
ncbi:MAG: MATE family efflux transporter [FCB group bacterium]|jgi:MATE family multidrug resistance protein|nr:MATE family efflux transporter [FCB group bacterium]